MPQLVKKNGKTYSEILMEYNYVKPGSPEHIQNVEGGYKMTVDEASHIVKTWATEPQRYPFEVFKKAEAMLAAIKATPVVISTRKPWEGRDPMDPNL